MRVEDDGHRQGNVAKGLVAGLVGGLAASWMMNKFQAALSNGHGGGEKSHGAQSMQQGQSDHGVGRELQQRGSDEPDENAAMRAGTAVLELLFNRKLNKRERELAGELAHYAMGTMSGAIYGATAEVTPIVRKGQGSLFGATVWLVADEGLVPALGLSNSATEYPISTHAYSLASHLVYGWSTETVRNAVRQII